MSNFLFSNRYRLLKLVLPFLLLGYLCYLSQKQHRQPKSQITQNRLLAVKKGTPQDVVVTGGTVINTRGSGPAELVTLRVGDVHVPVDKPRSTSWQDGDIISIEGSFRASGILKPVRTHRHPPVIYKYLMAIPGILLALFLLVSWLRWDPEQIGLK